MDFGDLSDNPFAIELSKPKHTRRKSVVSALKFLLLVAVCLTVTLLISSQSRRWLVHRLIHDFDSLSGEAKQTRLIQIADLDALAIEPLVKALVDDDMNVARTAYDLLRQSQTSWTVLEHGEQQRRHALMVEALKSIAVYMPDDRTGWGTSLLQQTILATVERRDEQSRGLYRDATHAIEILSLSDRSGPSILSSQPLDPLTPKRLTVRSEPLPVSFSGLESDSQAPNSDSQAPGSDSQAPGSDSQALGTPLQTAGRLRQQPSSTSTIISRSSRNDSSQPPQSAVEEPSVYRSSSMRLQAIDPTEPVILHEIGQPRETSYQAGDLQQADEIQSVTHLVDSPMETFDDKSVMHWLGSPHQVLRDKARLELISRGYDGTQLNIATQIASGDVQTRIALIDAIAHSDSIDPRPWLLMMLSDESRDVKLRVISVLATMKDPEVNSRLRMHLVDERDPTVGFRIRRVLDLR